ncbi:MAG: hypothetical protein HUU15_09280 [Candidatus Brocadiae bacterium]|nr:hypothetical protein [Candidatus Brocadiia bacterium]
MDAPTPQPPPRTVADFLARMNAVPPGTRPRKKKAPAVRVKKPLGPQGKVPRGVRGLARRKPIAEAARRSAELDRVEARDVRRWLLGSPAWAVSLALHLLAAVVMMNVVYFAGNERVGQMFRLALRLSPPGGALEGDQDNGVDGSASEDSPPPGAVADLPADAGTQQPPRLEFPPPSDGSVPSLPMKVVELVPAGGGEGLSGIYAGRGGAGRGSALERYGGDGVSEQAVADGLAWLAEHQSDDGGWEMGGFSRKCPAGQKCEDGRNDYWSTYFDAYRSSVTGLATLAFLGAGFSHAGDRREAGEAQIDGKRVRHPYCDVVDRGLRFLCRIQRADGFVVSGAREQERAMYSHGFGGLAIVEAYSMTHDDRLKAHAQRAVNAVVAAQQEEGGWDYSYGRTGRSDTSVTSWQVILLRSARAAGLSVPKRTWERARRFMELVTDLKAGTIGYDVEPPNQRVSPGCNAMVAAGWVTRLYLGMAEDQVLEDKFARVVREAPPRYDATWGHCDHWTMLAAAPGKTHWSLYYTYNATLAMFHHGGKDWEDWNRKMRACTLPAQRKGGHARGSWDPVTSDGSFGGRVYATAMNVLNLEIYYRFLPVHEVGAEFGLAPLADDVDWRAVAEGTERGTFHIRKAAEEEPADPDEALARLLRSLQSDDMMTRRNAAKELARRKDAGAAAALIQAARTESTSLKPVLIEYLGGLGDVPDVVNYLIGELSDTAPRIRSAALSGLRKATGQDFGDSAADWIRWWRNREQPK